MPFSRCSTTTTPRRGPAAFSVALGLAAFAAATSVAQTNDPDIRFVEALRSRGESQLAIEYLTRVAEGGVATEGLRKRVPYELAVTRLQAAREISEANRRDAAVALAQRDLEKFIAATDDQELVGEGRARLGAALSDQGFRLVAKSKTSSKGSERTQLLKDARKAYDASRGLQTESAQAFASAIDKYKSVKPGSPLAKKRLGLRRERARARVMAARSLQDKADTYAPSSKTFKSLKEQAAEELLTLYDEYVDEPIGMYAHLWEGQCYQALGKHKLAKGCFEELIIQDAEEPVFRTIVTLGHAHLAESRLAEGEAQQALDGGSRWHAQLRQADAGPAAASLSYQLGEAARQLAAEETGSAATRLLTRARALFREASRTPGEFQSAAVAKLKLVNDALGSERQPPQTFAEAAQRGRDAVVAMKSAALAAKVANKGGDGKADEAIESAKRDAAEAFRTALSLVDDETDTASLNEARYFLSYIFLEQGEYLQAAAIGEFLTRSYPDDPSAEKAARLAMWSLKQLYNQALADGASPADSFEVNRLRGVARFVTRRWAGQPIAESALADLMSLALASGDLEQARGVLDNAPESKRTALSLKLASAMWEQAARASATAGDDAGARRAALQSKANALAMLRESFPAARKAKPVTSAVATAGLYLAQALLEEGDAKESAKLLEDKTVGALTLVDRKDPAVDRPGFSAEAYKTALRAFVATTPPRTDDAIAMMDKLEAAVGGSGKNLTRIYFGLGLQLQRQIADLNAAGKSRAAKQLTDAFGVFLTRLGERLGDADWITQQWIGQTFSSLGKGLEGDGDAAARRDYYQHAAAVFQSMIDRAAAEPSFAPSSTSVLAARIQLGAAQRNIGDFQQALDTFSSVLITKPTLLDVQKDAAYTYQAWGEAGEPDQLFTAIRGGRLDPSTNKNLVWGWSKLAAFAGRAARVQPKYKDLFFECWLNVATCRYLAAEQASGAEQSKQLASARRTIRSMVLQYPDLGGPQRRGDFDRLLKQVQTLEGADPVGLKELES